MVGVRKYASQSPGSKLRELFLKSGNFTQLEVEVTKWSRSQLDRGKRGLWCTKLYLLNDKHWSK